MSNVFSMNKFRGQHVEKNKWQKEAFAVLIKVLDKKTWEEMLHFV